MKISPARKSAFQILYKIEKEKAFSSILLPIYEENLENKDRSLCHNLVLGILRKKLYLDEIIKKYTNKKLNKFDLEVLISLRLGIYQLLFLDKIPSYSAINESVNLVKFAKKKSASGLVNAVLRKVSKNKVSLSFSNEIKRASIETSHPIWLVEKWIRQFGTENAFEIADANNITPNLAFRLTGKYYQQNEDAQKEILTSFSNDAFESNLVKGSYFSDKLRDNLRKLANENLIYFQDIGSQLIAESVELKRYESFLDVCASPGSKTTFVAKNKKNHIVAGDFFTHRMKTLQENCKNQNVEFVDLVQYDATQTLPFAEDSFDVILIDAPCSGTGTIRHNPEIRYNLSENDFDKLSNKQLQILKNASKLIKKKGRIIYSTCSLEVEENEEVIKKFLDNNSDFKLVRPNVSDKFLTKDDFARTFPHRDEMDGFFIAILIRC